MLIILLDIFHIFTATFSQTYTTPYTMKQTLQTLLAEGKTAQVLAELRKLSLSDSELTNAILQTSARFAEMERQQHAGTLAQTELGIERNKINAALLAMIDRLDDGVGVTSSQTAATTAPQTIVQNAEKIYNINHIDKADFS